MNFRAHRGNYLLLILLICLSLECQLSSPAYALSSVAQFNFEQEDFVVKCYSWKTHNSCSACQWIWDGPMEWWTQSCSASSTKIIENGWAVKGFSVFAEASADAAWTPIACESGHVETRFTYSVPFAIRRVVSVKQVEADGILVPFLEFPLVEWQVNVDISGEVEVDGNEGPDEEAEVIEVYGPGGHTFSSNLIADDGREVIDEQYTKNYGPWLAPSVIEGDSISFDTILCPGEGVMHPDEPPEVIQALCDSSGEKHLINVQRNNRPRLKVGGKMKTYSQGEGDAYGFCVDGGEALACFGKNTTMDSFGTSCNSDGISVTVETRQTGTASIQVQKASNDEWLVTQIPPATFTATMEWGYKASYQYIQDEILLIESVPVTITCDQFISTPGANPDGSNWSLEGSLRDGESLVATVFTAAGPASCWAAQELPDLSISPNARKPYIETSNDCGARPLLAGDSRNCKFTNTLLVVGIPTLNQIGLAILTTLMLVIGFFSFRRLI